MRWFGCGLVPIHPRKWVEGAQRPKASEGESESLDKLGTLRNQCSTPEGIGGGIRNRGRAAVGIVHVLNARRHRRGNQGLDIREEFAESECSTPEGIGGGISPGVTRCRGFFVRAQRPKASEGESAAVDAAFDIDRACSTPEGIGGGISSALTVAARTGGRAQRPKASEGESGCGWLTAGGL